MCRALKVLCAAPSPERLARLKRATVSVSWELTGGATTTEELIKQVDDLEPDVVVAEGMDDQALETIRARHPRSRVLVVERDALETVRDAILGLPPIAGPVSGPQGERGHRRPRTRESAGPPPGPALSVM